MQKVIQEEEKLNGVRRGPSQIYHFENSGQCLVVSMRQDTKGWKLVSTCQAKKVGIGNIFDKYLRSNSILKIVIPLMFSLQSTIIGLKETLEKIFPVKKFLRVS